MSTKKEYINKEKINYKILLELEEKIKNKISLTKEEINYFLTCLVIITRTKIINKNGKLENGCDLAQSMICHYLEELNEGTYTLTKTDNLTGTTDTKVTPPVRTYTGFNSPISQEVTIKGDGTAVVNLAVDKVNELIDKIREWL